MADAQAQAVMQSLKETTEECLGPKIILIILEKSEVSITHNPKY